jgi:hypothetical protein
MRLLNTKTLQLQEFYGDIPERFAILSHRWGDNEVSFQDLTNRRNFHSAGFAKIENFCAYAALRGFSWAWCDTCCIDKSSSAELTESINSMWSWYRMATECYVFLADIPSWVDRRDGKLWQKSNEGKWRLQSMAVSALRRSVWFTRGWTLQELLAPDHLLFFNEDWRAIATKQELALELSTITGIPARYLRSPERIPEASIAMRMGWVSRRTTKRMEDMAYCMLGIFDVNMPMLYGEGKKAFMRLQLEIIKKSDDDSIFAWESDVGHHGLLATWPTAFKHCGNIINIDVEDDRRLPYAMTNKGMELRLPALDLRPEILRPEPRARPPSPLPQAAFGPQSDSLFHPERYECNRRDSARRRYYESETYSTMRTVVPNDERSCKKIQLACGSCQDFDMNDYTSEQLELVARQHVLGITLSRHRSGWKRSNCQELEVWDGYEDKVFTEHALFYVPQEGL